MCRTTNLARRRGMTLIELLIASSMLLLLAGVLGGLASAVQTSSSYSQGHANAVQHARVTMERISREIGRATAAGEHAGFAVLCDEIGGMRYPDTLLVWRPVNGTPTNANGPPLISELVIYCADPDQPENLLELRAPHDSRPIPLDVSVHQSPWPETVAAVKTDPQCQRVVLTNLLRVVSENSVSSTSNQRAAVRFEQAITPSHAELSDYRSGRLTWSNLAWPQGIYGSQTGMRQSWVRLELQLMPSDASSADTAGQPAVPFLGSAALYYPLSP